MNKIAVDTNVLVYLHDIEDSHQRAIALKLMTMNPVISSQVISEYLNVTKRLLKIPKQALLGNALVLLSGCTITSTSVSTLQLALALTDQYDFQLFDSIVVAAALESQCNILYTEDLQHNLLVQNSMKIINPFIITL